MMYNRLSLICLIFFGTLTCVHAQNKIESTGNVGIGTLSPSTPLEILSPISDSGLRIGSEGKNTTIRLHVAGGDYGYLWLGGDTKLRGNGQHSVFEGNVGIGTSSPTHKLTVNGNIRAHEIKLETSNWPDYVFDDDYTLKSLKETNEFIKANGHLPGLRSAKEYQQKGVDILELNQKLLEKIEELTLQLIKMDERNQDWEGRYRKQEKDIADLTEELKLLKTQIDR